MARADAAQAEAEATLHEYQQQLAERPDRGEPDPHRGAGRASVDHRGGAHRGAERAGGDRRARGSCPGRRPHARRKPSCRREVGRLAHDLAAKIVGESLEDDARAKRGRRPVHRRARVRGRRAGREPGGLMLGSSREALAASREGLLERADSDGLRRGVRRAARRGGAARRRDVACASTLADSGTSVTARSEIVRRLLGSRICAGGARAGRARRLAALVPSRATCVDAARAGSAPRPRSSSAEHEGRLDAVEDELFRFGRVVDARRRAAAGAQRPGAHPASARRRGHATCWTARAQPDDGRAGRSTS